MRSLTCAVCLAAIVVGLASARGQSAQDKAAAEALFREGRDLAKKGKLVEACSRFESSQKLDPSSGTLLNLGDCYEKQGRTASAWGTFEEASRLAKSRGEAAKQHEASRRARALEFQLSRLTIDVPAASRRPGLEVRRDETVVPEGTWGLAVPVDPGPHRITASVGGRDPWTKDIRVEPGGEARVEVPAPGAKPPPPKPSPPPVKPKPSPAPSPSPSPASASASAPGSGSGRLPGPEPLRGSPGAGPSAASVFLAGLGIAFIGTGIYFGVAAGKVEEDAEGHRGEWDAAAQDLEAEGKRDEFLAVALTAAGVVAIGTGVALYLFTGRASAPSVSAAPVPGGGFMVVEGRF